MAPERQADPPGLPAVAAAAAALVSGIGLLTLTGALGRVQRNNGQAFAIAIALVVIGAAVWVAGAMISERARKANVLGFSIGMREGVKAIGLLFSLIGLVVGFYVAIGTADDTEQPAVALRVSDDGGSVTGTARAANLSSEDRLNVYVDGLVSRKGGAYKGSNLYQAFVGPNADGEASNDVHVRLPPGRFDAVGIRAFTARNPEGCGRYPLKRAQAGEEGTGCVIIRLPPRPSHPQLAASWEGTGRSGGSLKLTLEAADVRAVPKDNLVLLRVLGMMQDRTPVSLYRSLIVVPSTGAVKREVRVPVESGMRTVCAEGLFIAGHDIPPRAKCPIGQRAARGAVELRVPRP